MMLRHSLGLEREAAAIEGGVAASLARGIRTADLMGGDPAPPATTRKVGHTVTEAVVEALSKG
jgi:isocitrate/isopropylmalate dehydrogenase